jgi:hypothetical protein
MDSKENGMEKAEQQRSSRPYLSDDGQHVIYQGVKHRFTTGPARDIPARTKVNKDVYDPNGSRRNQLAREELYAKRDAERLKRMR